MAGQRQWHLVSQQAAGRGRTVSPELRPCTEAARSTEKVRDKNKDPADYVRSRVQRCTATVSRETARAGNAGLGCTDYFYTLLCFLKTSSTKRPKYIFLFIRHKVVESEIHPL